ncbi:TlpA family protein disulfide reductase [Streptomyces alkaliterrae]|uniref:Redoxin domain-containing protein n=1 Tax=Streptomyces alkaliterrae TaxID=2213162 RepID=A0A5P0YTU4_9ACTN|nr:TlpA disulfide reductase family protein [Streptomyces alkaliterrae]MBB1257407.1 TlpA family protein disulfide reductase [Streptomyces alkaliterrae]MQS03340.1 redoxin domain-containing protein [Streptomyces alkaliterrae]
MSLSRAPRGTSRRRVTALTAAVLAGVLGLTACGSEDKPASSDGGYIEGTGQITTVAADDRQPAPDLSGKTVEGGELKLSDYRGKVVVLNVWGSWCPPCRSEAPAFAKVSKELEKDGVQFVGLNIRDLDVANAKAFDRNFEIAYPSLYDPSGKTLLRFPKGSLNPQAIPSTLVLDREGKIATRALKPLSEPELREIIEPVLAEK